MPIKPTVKIDPNDIVRYLLYQQFYYGEDRIYGRTKDRSEYIDGAGKAIETFYLLITKHLNMIDEGYPHQYLEFFNKSVHKIPTEAIMNKYRDYKDNLGLDMSRQMTLTVIIGECLSKIQKTSFEASIIKLIEFVIEKRSLKPEQGTDIKEKIKSLYGISNPNIGMIYSLSFMKFIAKTIHHKDIEEKCNQLLNKYYGSILEVLEG